MRLPIELSQLHRREGRMKEAWRLSKFCLVGLSGVGVGLGTLWLLTEGVGLFYVLSAAIAHLLAVTNNFIWNNVWTFADRPRYYLLADVSKRWFKFLLSASVALGVNLGVLTLLTEVFEVHYFASAICGIAVATPVNFLASSLWVWKQPDGHVHGESLH